MIPRGAIPAVSMDQLTAATTPLSSLVDELRQLGVVVEPDGREATLTETVNALQPT